MKPNLKINYDMIPEKHKGKIPLSKMKYKIEVKLVYNSLKVYINGLTHISISNIDEVFGFNSYSVGTEFFYIVITSKSGITIETNYQKREIWESILKGLDKISLI